MKIFTAIFFIGCLIACNPKIPSNDDLAVQFAFFSIFKDVNFHPVILSGENYISITNKYHYLTFDTTGYTRIDLKKEDIFRIKEILPIHNLNYLEESDIEANVANIKCNFIITDFYKDDKNHYLIAIIVGTKKSGFWVEYKISLEKGLFMIIDVHGGVS